MRTPASQRRRCRSAFWLAVLLVAPLSTVASSSAASAGGLCEAAGREAAAALGVPEELMRAIALVETGRRRGGGVEPWPWAMNATGKGTWFETRKAVLADAAKRLRRGDRNFDLGCFQINHRWHGDAFASLEAMIEPRSNAAYAARFLSELYRETGDWMIAAGLYHSRTPTLSRAYRARVARVMGAQLPEVKERTALADVQVPSEGRKKELSALASAATIRTARDRTKGRFIDAGAGRALIEAATGRLLVPKPGGPLIGRLPRAGRPPGEDGTLFPSERHAARIDSQSSLSTTR